MRNRIQSRKTLVDGDFQDSRGLDRASSRPRAHACCSSGRRIEMRLRRRPRSARVAPRQDARRPVRCRRRARPGVASRVDAILDASEIVLERSSDPGRRREKFNRTPLIEADRRLPRGHFSAASREPNAGGRPRQQPEFPRSVRPDPGCRHSVGFFAEGSLARAGTTCRSRSRPFPLPAAHAGQKGFTSALAEGTQNIIRERNRLKLFEAAQAFLDEAKRS